MTEPGQGSMSTEEAWRAYLLGTHPDILRARRMFRWLPADPRCQMCRSPFHGIGRLVVSRFGFVPWEKNPKVCRRCITTMARHGAGGADIELSMLFADVRGSTTLAEGMSDGDFSALLNRFYATATTVLIDKRAVIDKFVGDEVIGLFLPMLAGDRHAALAIEAAEALLEVTGHGRAEAPWAPLGIGVHTGSARVGLVGTPGGVMDFTALGDAVNTTSRLASNAAPGEILVSDATTGRAGLDPAGREHRELRLKGRTTPVGVTVLTPTAAAR